MLIPMRSFTEAAGFMLSSFTTIRANAPSDWGILFNCTNGVRPTNSVISFAIRISIFLKGLVKSF